MGEPARYQLKVRHYEVDQYGHVNHAQYVHYLEVARIEALDALGLSLGEMRDARLSDPRRRPGGEVSGAGALRRHARDHHVRARDPRRAIDLDPGDSRSREPEVLVTAEVTGAFATEDGRPARAPASFREELAALCVPDGAGIPGE